MLCLALGVAGCGDADPYAELSPAEMAFVIPESAGWGPADPCANSDCRGPVDVEDLAEADRLAIDTIEVIEGAVGDDDSARVRIAVAETLAGEPHGAAVEKRLWGTDVEVILDALTAGHDVWAATPCQGMIDDVVCHLVIFDTEERFAGIGSGASLYFTRPLARQAAAANATTARAFIEAALP